MTRLWCRDLDGVRGGRLALQALSDSCASKVIILHIFQDSFRNMCSFWLLMIVTFFSIKLLWISPFRAIFHTICLPLFRTRQCSGVFNSTIICYFISYVSIAILFLCNFVPNMNVPYGLSLVLRCRSIACVYYCICSCMYVCYIYINIGSVLFI